MSSIVSTQQECQKELEDLYLASLNDRELKAYHIAKDHLGMSFSMERSNGYKQWKKNRDERLAGLVHKTSS